MKKILLAGILFFALTPLFAGSEDGRAIKSINITGTMNVKEKTVRSALKSKVGKPYSQDKVKNDIQDILSLGYFDDVQVAVDTDSMRVTYAVKEKPYITKISVKGNQKFSQGRLKDEFTLKEKDYYDVAKMEESRSKALTLYLDKGYADAKIDIIPTTDEATNRMTVSFLVSEGHQILIGSVTVSGVKSFKTKKIAGLMKTKKKKVYKADTIGEDRKAIEEFYKNNGFTEASVGEPIITYNAERTQMFIEIVITEGIKYHIGSIGFSGNAIYTSGELSRIVSLKKGELYKQEQFNESKAALMDQYSDRGYLRAQIEPQLQPDNEKGEMNIIYKITEGPVVYLGRLFIDGLESTKEFVIRREVLLKEGDVFSSSKVKRSLEKIYNLGFIDAAEPELQPTDKPDIMDMVLNVTEGKPGMLSAGAGYSSVNGMVGTLQLSHMNLFGRAEKLNLMWEFGGITNYQISWTEPWFLNKPMSLSASVFDTLTARDYANITSAYNETRVGGSVTIGPRISDNLGLQFGYSYEEIGVSVQNVSISSVVPNSLDITSSVSGQIIWDTRDNVFDPTRGDKQSLGVQLAGGPVGGSVNFVKPTIKSSWFFPTFWKFVLSLNGTAGLVQNFGSSADVPIYERFYVGGADTVRGYKYRGEIGSDNGGKAMSYFNAEYKFPIAQEKNKTILEGAFFADMGGDWDNPGDFTMQIGQSKNDMKSGVGFGIRFTTPVFPLRLDWGYGLNHNPGEELSQFYFTIGNVF